MLGIHVSSRPTSNSPLEQAASADSRFIGCRQVLVFLLLFAFLLGCQPEQSSRPLPCNLPFTVRFAQQAYTTDEAADDFEIVLQRNTSADFHLTGVRVIAGTATKGADFEMELRNAVFDGDSLGYFHLRLLDDNLVEPTETVVLQLLDPDSGYCIEDAGRTILNILDNDSPGPFHAIRVPLSTGASWTYDYKEVVGSDGAFPWETRGRQAVTVTDLFLFREMPYSVLSGLPGLRTLRLRQEASAIFQVIPVPPDSDTLHAGIYDDLPWLVLDFDAPAGTIWAPVAVDTVLYPCEPPVTYVISVQSLGRGVVVTPAGTFQDAAAFRYRSRVSGSPMRPVPSRADIRLYFVDGIGIVRMAGTSSGYNYSASFKWDLFSWQLPESTGSGGGMVER